MSEVDILITNSRIFTANPEQPIIENGAIAIVGDEIVWLGNTDDLPEHLITQSTQSVSFPTGWITPGLIDCHTHLIYGGNRSAEFRRQLEGESYQQISASGGGILSTVRETRAASEDELYESAAKRLEQWLNQGVTHIEIKSGYGLDLPNEMKMLRVAQRLADNHPIDVSKTLLAAHTLAPEFSSRFSDPDVAKEEYIRYICETILPTAMAEGLVDAVDGFCEEIAFNINNIDKLFKVASKAELPLKLHAEQLSNQQGSLLAAQYDALSADHLEYLDEESTIAMAESNTVAVLLPAAFYFLRETKLPPMKLLQQHGVTIAIASDHNPGSAPVESLTLVMNMACRLFGLTPMQALYGVTINAAKALGVAETKGSLEVGKQADILHWDIHELDDLSYYFGAHQPDMTIHSGRLLNQPTRMSSLT